MPVTLRTISARRLSVGMKSVTSTRPVSVCPVVTARSFWSLSTEISPQALAAAAIYRSAAAGATWLAAVASVAGIVGPLIVNGVLDHYVANHLPKQQAYPVILHIMAALMVVGFIANFLVRPVAQKYWLESTSSQVGAAR